MQSSFTKISRHRQGCRLPMDISDRSTPDYMPGVCVTRKMTAEEWEKYGPVNAEAAAVRAAKRELKNEMLKKEMEAEDMSTGRLTAEKLSELLAQGKTCDEINQEYYPHKPGFVLSLARRKKLIPEEDLPPKKIRIKKQQPEPEPKKEAIDLRTQLINLAEFLRTFPALNPAEDLTKEDAELLLAIDTLIEFNIRGELRETQQTVQKITKTLEDFQTESKQILQNLDENTVKLQRLCEDTMKFVRFHRHQVGAGHFSAIPEEVLS